MNNIQTGRIAGWLLGSMKQAETRQLASSQGAVMPIYREAAFRYISLAFAILMVPYSLANFYSGQYLLGVIEVALFIPLVYHCWRLLTHSKPLFTPVFMMSTSLAVVSTAMLYSQSTNIYWFPAMVLTCYFILEHRQATLFNFLYLLLALPLSLLVLPAGHAIFFMLSLLMASGCSYVFSIVVYRQEQHLQYQTMTDTLTHAYNRRYLMECMEQSINLHNRYQKPASVILLDVDYFKKINDNWGHVVGDEALIALVKLLHSRIRRSDKLFRYGGEEFVILLEETRLDEALALAEDFCELVRTASILEQQKITVSCGVAELNQESSLAWLGRCDEALYTAKNTGRDRVVKAE